MNVSGRLSSMPPSAGRWRHVAADVPLQFGLLLALALPLLAFALHGDIGLSLADEGFLWYGAQRVLHGEVPLRDFQSYDIGRYFWSAAWMFLGGSSGILPVRAGNAVLAACTVAIATGLVHAARPRPAWLPMLAAVVFWAWMIPHEKIADSFTALLLVGGLARLLRRPGPTRCWLEFGACLGLAGTIGINHGLYGVIGLALAIAYLAGVGGESLSARRLAWLALGGAIGYAPVIAFHLFVPGFTAGFVDTIRQLFEAGTTNVTLPLPSPAGLLDIAASAEARHQAPIVLFFICAPVFLLVCTWRLLSATRPATDPPHPVFVAAVLMSVPYAHYAWSRADLVHVAISVLPLMLAAFTFMPRRRPLANRFAVVGLALISLACLLPKQPGRLALLGGLEPVEVQGESLRLGPDNAAELRLLLGLVATHAPGAWQSVYAAPYWPGAYAAIGRRSPTWELYALFPASEQRQRRELERLAAARVALALVNDWRVDGRSDLGLNRTHPRIAAHLERCLRELDPRPDPTIALRVFVRAADRCEVR